MNPSHTPRAEFLAGVRDTFPLVVGAMPFGLIFGALALSNGLSVGATMGFSLFVFAGSSQFIGSNLVGAGAGMLLIILTTFIVNLRHALYSATLLPYVKHLPQRWLIPLSFWLTDETFVFAHQRYIKPDDSPNKHWYQLGSSVIMYVNWNACTLIGVIAGQTFKDIGQLGLDFAMTVTFIGMLVPTLQNRPMLVAALTAGLSALLLEPVLENKLWLVVATILGVAGGVLAEQWKGEAA